MFPQTLILIRHATSEANALMRALDQDPYNEELSRQLSSMEDRDWEITEQGIRASVWAGDIYRRILDFNRKLPLLFCSTHIRGMQTAYHLSSTWERPAHLWQSSDRNSDWPRWKPNPNLVERSWGAWNNISWRQFELQYPEESRRLSIDPLRHKVACTGAESIMDVRNTRVERFLRMLERDCQADDLVIAVTHADWIMACRSLLENLDSFAFRDIYNDRTQWTRNLDAVCYTRTDPHRDFEITTGYPTYYCIMRIPPEETDIESIQPFQWKDIERKDYARQELLQLRYE